MSQDRTVHGFTGDGHGGAVVRYDRSGKYYLEFPAESGLKRRALTLSEAVELATPAPERPGARPILDRPGGLTFDARVRKTSGRQA